MLQHRMHRIRDLDNWSKLILAWCKCSRKIRKFELNLSLQCVHTASYNCPLVRIEGNDILYLRCGQIEQNFVELIRQLKNLTEQWSLISKSSNIKVKHFCYGYIKMVYHCHGLNDLENVSKLVFIPKHINMTSWRHWLGWKLAKSENQAEILHSVATFCYSSFILHFPREKVLNWCILWSQHASSLQIHLPQFLLQSKLSTRKYQSTFLLNDSWNPRCIFKSNFRYQRQGTAPITKIEQLQNWQSLSNK